MNKWQKWYEKYTEHTTNADNPDKFTLVELLAKVEKKAWEDYQLMEALYNLLKKGQQRGRDWDE